MIDSKMVNPKSDFVVYLCAFEKNYLFFLL